MNWREWMMTSMMVLGACVALSLLLASQVRAQQIATVIEDNVERFAVYYGDAEKAESFLPYKVMVFDADKHPPLRVLKGRKKEILAYVSVFEAAPYRAHYESLKKAGLLIQPDGKKGREFIDIRKREWADLLMNEIMPQVVKEGFDGVMLDTLDDALALEERQPKTYSGMTQAAVQTVGLIRMHYPYMKIMVNRAFAILPQIQMKVDMVLAESTMTKTNLKDKTSVMFTDAERSHVMAVLKEAKRSVPELRIYALDYWDMKDKATVATIYQRQRSLGFVPYVATPDLQALYLEDGVKAKMLPEVERP